MKLALFDGNYVTHLTLFAPEVRSEADYSCEPSNALTLADVQSLAKWLWPGGNRTAECVPVVS
jgi:hypothetical protein